MKRLAFLAVLAVAIGVRAETKETKDEIPDGFAQIHWAPPTVWEWVSLSPAVVFVALDISQTLDIASRPAWQAHETNFLLGDHPSKAKVLLFGAASELTMTGVWFALPPRVRWIVPLLVTTVEIFVVSANAQKGYSFAVPW